MFWYAEYILLYKAHVKTINSLMLCWMVFNDLFFIFFNLFVPSRLCFINQCVLAHASKWLLNNCLIVPYHHRQTLLNHIAQSVPSFLQFSSVIPNQPYFYLGDLIWTWKLIVKRSRDLQAYDLRPRGRVRWFVQRRDWAELWPKSPRSNVLTYLGMGM